MYKVLVWDYDPEDGYFVTQRWNCEDKSRAINYAFDKAGHEDAHYVGAAVFCDGTMIVGYGFHNSKALEEPQTI